MASVNKWIGIGHLGKDPEVRYMPSGKSVANFSIACSESWKDKNTGEKQERTEWVNLTAFDKLGEICGKYLKKGAQIYVEGRLQTDKYDKDGQTHYSTKVIISDMKMLGKKDDSAHQDGGAPGPQSVPVAAPAKVNYEDDIPFN